MTEPRGRGLLCLPLLATALPLAPAIAQPSWWADQRRRAEYEH